MTSPLQTPMVWRHCFGAIPALQVVISSQSVVSDHHTKKE